MNIAIDGPSGAGKSSLAKRVAKEKGYIYVDTGAMYRAMAYYAISKDVDVTSEREAESVLPEIKITLKNINGVAVTLLNGQELGEEIRTEQVSKAASDISAHPVVRAFLLQTQQNIAKENAVIMDGRDIATVVLPGAECKVFLTASAQKRANRRLLQLQQAGQQAEISTVLAEIIKRDDNDSNRAAAPLKKAQDAVLLDTSELDFEQSYTALCEIIQNAGEKGK